MSTTQHASGTIWAQFGHRLAIEGTDGRVLADLGPKGAEGLTLKPGDTVAVTGERKPSEIKVATLTLADGTVHTIDWPKKPDHAEGKAPADAAAAIAAVAAAGYAVDGAPVRKPRHFEIVGTRAGARDTLHVEFDGRIRKTEAAKAPTSAPAKDPAKDPAGAQAA